MKLRLVVSATNTTSECSFSAVLQVITNLLQDHNHPGEVELPLAAAYAQESTEALTKIDKANKFVGDS